MSTILRALDRQRVDRRQGGDPEAILERNAVYREALRRRRPSPAAQRQVIVISTIALVVALLCMAALTWNWFCRPLPEDDRAVAAGSPANLDEDIPEPEPEPQPPPPQGSARKPLVRQNVSLRTRPLLHSPSPAVPGRPQASRVADEAGQVPGGYPIAPAPTPLPSAVPPSNPDGAAPSRPPAAASDSGDAGKREPPRENPNDFLTLSGIVLDPQNPSALINNDILRPGDTIQGVKVLAIDNGSHVKVEYRGKTYLLALK